MGIWSLFFTLIGLAAAVVVVSEYVTKLTKAKGIWAQVQAWTLSILAGIMGSWMSFGIFHGTSTKGGIVYGILIGLISNGIFDISFIRKVIKKITADINEIKDEIFAE